jgi:hypothetical protein
MTPQTKKSSYKWFFNGTCVISFGEVLPAALTCNLSFCIFAFNHQHLVLSSIAAQLKELFPFQPTPSQEHLFGQLEVFLTTPNVHRPAFLLKGYAGTGKTSVVSTLVHVLPQFRYRSVLLAPTGRAAKVMASYSKRQALTIHKKIYKQVADPDSGYLHFEKQRNLHKHTLFIVDEASMLSDESEFGTNGLLADLVSYVYEDPTNKLLLIGDTAQLPPVNQPESPALEAAYLEHNYQLSVMRTELTDVMRQDLNSGILYNATQLRNQMQRENLSIHLRTRGFTDTFRMTGDRLEDGLRYAYDKFGVENTVVVCRSNKSAVQYNQYIRRAIQFREEEVEAGDFLMVVRNNYYVLPEDSPAGFIANGDYVEVLRIVHFEEMYGHRFATLELKLLDYPEQPAFEAKVMLDTLHSPQASLSNEEYRELYKAVRQDIEMNYDTKKEQQKALRTDSFLNALQIKYAYALTCHKSQGGQWYAVFVDQGYLKDEMVNKEYLRWLYTAITRASGELYLMNFHEKFFEKE